MPVIYKSFQSVLANKEGKKLFYPRVVLTGNVDTEQVAKEIAELSSLSTGDLVQTLLYLSKVVGECHVHHPFFAKCTEAFFFQQLAYLVETYFPFSPGRSMRISPWKCLASPTRALLKKSSILLRSLGYILLYIPTTSANWVFSSSPIFLYHCLMA